MNNNQKGKNYHARISTLYITVVMKTEYGSFKFLNQYIACTMAKAALSDLVLNNEAAHVNYWKQEHLSNNGHELIRFALKINEVNSLWTTN